jgi:hypothetical protein
MVEHIMLIINLEEHIMLIIDLVEHIMLIINLVEQILIIMFVEQIFIIVEKIPFITLGIFPIIVNLDYKEDKLHMQMVHPMNILFL